ncbi:MAG: TetR/AcrR family transcriptional regulator [Clostridiales Family XIII bacterium]|jgi:AcrR family transcriptional regulator|nr:TetR/AcrR family transcriptional regulator [Clostridiales Family XIII bacterium]
MPKVAPEYQTDKKNFILDCTGEVLKAKPLYLVTMRDIIQKAGFSQGAIYRYYAGLDEIYVDFVNRHTPNIALEQNIDALLRAGRAEAETLYECILEIGRYIEALLGSVGGRTCFELMVLYAYDFEKRNAVFPKLRFKQSLEYAQRQMMAFALDNVEKGVFRPQIPVRSIVLLMNGFIDGIAQSAAFDTAEDGTRRAASAVDIPEMFWALAKAVVNLL